MNKKFLNHSIFSAHKNPLKIFLKTNFSSRSSIYFADQYDKNESKFKKILIANRGEIACRIIKTCKVLGIETVAIFSEIDSRSMHVKLADEAYCVGPAPSKDSYLNVEKILEVIRNCGAEAVHPGYGFLSENTDFAKELEKSGIAFVGPNHASIHAMGDKIESKLIAQKAKVNTIPGYEGIIRDAEHCVELAQQIGYPVMIKASAGGGGKGMRMAYNDHEALEGFRFSSSEALSSFNDERLLIEKFIEHPRHIEIQVLCDKHGNGIYLNERECSIQRRNQKVIEEAPSTFLNPNLREAMGKQAVALALNVGYDSAGTVEFLVDKQKNFYFLEMNTRLQVEHPITEFICGIDLVHQMLRVAKGHKLRHRQKDIQLQGWSIESRVYAENPYKNFGLPSVGRLTRYEEPTFIPNVRCDSGVTEGSEISIYYDPLICKLVTYGENRQQALDTMKNSLDQYTIRGLVHNIPLLRDIMDETKFVNGDFDTKYLYNVYTDGFKGRKLNQQKIYSLAAIASSIFLKKSFQSKSFLNLEKSNIFNAIESKNYIFYVDFSENELLKELKPIKTEILSDSIENPNLHTISINNEFNVDFNSDFSLNSNTLNFKINEKSTTVQLISLEADGMCQIQFEGTIFNLRVLNEKAHNYLKIIPSKPKIDIGKVIKSPMPGVVKSISCQSGDYVNEGQELCVIEAMKMQNSILSTSSGKVIKVNCEVGNTVDGDQVLIQLE